MFDNLFLTADHQAIPACLAKYPSARAHIEIVDSFVFQLLRAADVVVIIRIAAIDDDIVRSEEHTSELQSLMRTSSAVFCLQIKKTHLSNTCTHAQNYNT